MDTIRNRSADQKTSARTARDHLIRRTKELKLYGTSKYIHSMSKALCAVIDSEALSEQAKHTPDCFGLRNQVSHDTTCQACPVQILCLHRMAHVAMPRAAAKVGSFVRRELAAEMDIRPEDVYTAETLAIYTGSLPRRQANAPIRKYSRPNKPDASWARRYLAERRRYPELGDIPPGSRLYREFDGKRHCVLVEDGHYVVEGQRYPTLFCAGAAITGRHPLSGKRGKAKPHMAHGHWSVRKLFGQAIAEAAKSTH